MSILTMQLKFNEKLYHLKPKKTLKEFMTSILDTIPINKEVDYGIFFRMGKSSYQEITRESQYQYILSKGGSKLELELWENKSKGLQSVLSQAIQERILQKIYEEKLQAEELKRKEEEEKKKQKQTLEEEDDQDRTLRKKKGKPREERKTYIDEDEEEKTIRKGKKHNREVEEEKSVGNSGYKKEDGDDGVTIRKKDKKKEKALPMENDGFTLSNFAIVGEQKQQRLQLIEGCRVVSNEIKEQFKEMGERKAIFLATRRQVVHLVEQGTQIDYNNLEAIKQYISEKGHNYHEVESLSFLAKGGESYVMKGEIKLPVEVVMKMILPSKELTMDTLIGILNESHMINLLTNKDFVVEIFEEIIEFQEASGLILNYIVAVERAQQDIQGISKVWSSFNMYEKPDFYSPQFDINDIYFDSDLPCDQKLEYFTNEKLFYLLFKASEALAYIHEQNVYYGDMKEANLLVFRDYQVKIGDFGISIKLDPNDDINDEIYTLKGVTAGYSFEKFENTIRNDTGDTFSKYELLKNDYFGFCKAFESIASLCQKQFTLPTFTKGPRDGFMPSFDANSYFCKFFEEIKKADPIKRPLRSIIEEYRFRIRDDIAFLQGFLNQLIIDEKFFAIPIVLNTFWKDSFISQSVYGYFNWSLLKHFPFLSYKPKHEIFKEESIKENWVPHRFKEVKQDEVITSIQNYIYNSATVNQDFLEFLNVLTFYQPYLKKCFFHKFYEKCLGKFFKIQIKNQTLHPSDLRNISKEDLAAILSSSTFVKEYVVSKKPMLLTFITFAEGISNFEIDQTMQHRIQYLFEGYLYHNKRCEFNDFTYTKLLKTMELIILCQKPIGKKVQDIVQQLQSYSEKLNFFDSQSKFYMKGNCYNLFTYIHFDFIQKRDVSSQFSQNVVFRRDKFLSFGKDYYEYFFEFFQTLDKKQYLERQIINLESRIGQLGNERSSYEFQLYELLKNQFQQSKESEVMKSAMYHLKKACNFSLYEQKYSYLIALIEEYKEKNNLEKLKRTLDEYKGHSQIMYYILLAYYLPSDLKSSNQELILEYESQIPYISDLFNCNQTFKIATMKFLGKEYKHLDINFEFFFHEWFKWFHLQRVQNHISEQFTNEASKVKFEFKNLEFVEAKVDRGKIDGEVFLQFPSDKFIKAFMQNNKLEGQYLYQINTHDYESLVYKENQIIKQKFQLSNLKLEMISGHTCKLQKGSEFEYEGEVLFWKPHGTGIKTAQINDFNSNEFIEVKERGKFQMGSKADIVQQKFLKGQLIKEAQILNECYHGPAKEYYQSGKLMKEYFYQNDLLHGEFKEYYENGHIKMEMNSIHGKREGLFKMYFENGNLQQTTQFLKGKQEGFMTTYLEDGSKSTSVEFVNGEMSGKIRYFHLNGNVSQEMTMINQKMEGKYIMYDMDGNVTLEMNFKDGQPVV